MYSLFFLLLIRALRIIYPHIPDDVKQVSTEGSYKDDEEEGSQSSSSGTLTCSVPEVQLSKFLTFLTKIRA